MAVEGVGRGYMGCGQTGGRMGVLVRGELARGDTANQQEVLTNDNRKRSSSEARVTDVSPIKNGMTSTKDPYVGMEGTRCYN
jgi:hypothetical protein